MPLARFPSRIYIRTTDDIQFPDNTIFTLYQNGRVIETMDHLTMLVRAYHTRYPLHPNITTLCFTTLEFGYDRVVEAIKLHRHLPHVELLATWKVAVDRPLPGCEILITWLTVHDDESLEMETERCPC